MKTPIPRSVLSCARYTVAAYDVSAFSPVSYDVGGRALGAPTQLKRRRTSIRPVIIVATLACAIVVLALAAANADPISKTNGAVVVRYSDRIAFGAVQGRQHDNVAVESLIERRMRSLALGYRRTEPGTIEMGRATFDAYSAFTKSGRCVNFHTACKKN